MFPYMTKAKEHNLSVIILNPNQTSYVDKKPTDTASTNTEATSGDEQIPAAATSENTDNKEETGPNEELNSYYLSANPLPRPATKKIPNLSTNREHVLYVYDNMHFKMSSKKILYRCTFCWW